MSDIQTEKLPEGNGRLVGEVSLDNGEVIYVSPLSPYLLQSIIQKSKELHPDPDPAQYRVLVKGLPEGIETYEPLEMNPEYVLAAEAAKKKQVDYTQRAVAEIAVLQVAGETREETIARYTPELASITRFIVKPSDRWGAAVLYGLITTRLDVLKIFMASNQMPTVAGVNKAIKFFRLSNRGPVLNGSDRKEVAPGFTEAHNISQLQSVS